jgi:hypothetical protein
LLMIGGGVSLIIMGAVATKLPDLLALLAASAVTDCCSLRCWSLRLCSQQQARRRVR